MAPGLDEYQSATSRFPVSVCLGFDKARKACLDLRQCERAERLVWSNNSQEACLQTPLKVKEFARMKVKSQTSTTLPTKLPTSQVPVLPPKAPELRPNEVWDRSFGSWQARMTMGVSPYAMSSAWFDWAHALTRAPGRQAELAARFWRNQWRVMQAFGNDDEGIKPHPDDDRFDDEAWQKMPFKLFAQQFLAAEDSWRESSKHLHGMAQRSGDRVEFMTRQMLDAISPSNIPALNPEVIQKTLESGGMNFLKGARFLAEDLARIATDQPAESKEFEVGRNVACTPGEVVFRNEVFELIQYAPMAGEVRKEPILIVPAWIMKYYILDLSPENSLVKYLVGEGFTVFCISWINPSSDQRDLSLDDYRRLGVLSAIDEVDRICGGALVHACGYCLGGTILAIAAARMALDGDDRLASITLIAAQTDFSEAGELMLFVDENQVAYLEDLMWAQGYLDQKQMAGTFQLLRARDLIWSQQIRRFLLGEEEQEFDIGFWSKDATRMPYRMHSEYLRGLFLENRLTAGRFAVEGRVVALKDIKAPFFVFATEKDHIAPWRSVYKISLFTDVDLTFALASGGHNGGVLSEPGHPHRRYRIGHRRPDSSYMDPDSWFEGHETCEGSWWPAWTKWLAAQSSAEMVPARPPGGTERVSATLGSAPGVYVMQK